MVFANPLLLLGAGLIAVPIILHLIMRRKPRQLEFPALRFLQLRHETNQRRLRLRHLLLLLLRAAAIALLALALARPSVKFAGAIGSVEAPVAAALVFDTAPRMGYRQDNVTRLEAARQFGDWLLAQLPGESRIAVVDSQPGPAAFQVDRGSAGQRIGRLDFTACPEPLTASVEKALDTLAQSDLPRKEVYVFTDLARAAWPAEEAARLRAELDKLPDAGLFLIDVGVPQAANFRLSEPRLSGQVIARTSTLRVQAELEACGTAEGERTVELYLLDGKRQPQKLGEQIVPVPSGGAAEIEIPVAARDLGTHQGYLKLLQPDGLAADDTRYFTVESRPAWRVLIAAPDPPERYALFLREALAPAARRKRGEARFECEVVALNRLADMPLADYAALCLLDPTPLEPAGWRKLADYAAEGHGLGVFLGRNADKNAASFAGAEAQEVLAGRLVRRALAPNGNVFLAPRDLQHPALAAFRSAAGSIPWEAFPVLEYWQIARPEKGTGVIIPLSDGRPALVERPIGRGRAITMTTPISDRPTERPWNYLTSSEDWPFFILANELALYLVGSSNEQYNYLAGEAAILSLRGDVSQRSFLVTAPDGMKYGVSADLAAGTVVVATTDQPGNYRLQAGGTEGGVDRGFSVNLAMASTDLDRLDPQETKTLFGAAAKHIVRNRDQIERSVAGDRVGRELFPLLIVLVALALGLEHLVANRFYRER